jgi:hypothetical protein
MDQTLHSRSYKGGLLEIDKNISEFSRKEIGKVRIARGRGLSTFL